MAGGKSGSISVLVDSDVIFDFIAARLPFFNEAEQLFTYTEQGIINVVTLPHLIINVWQIRGHMKISNSAMHRSLAQLQTIVKVLNEPAEAITKALMVNNVDFEDWVTVECAKYYSINTIVSRNVNHFKNSSLHIYTPVEFINKLVS